MKTLPKHEVAYQDICALVSRHADKLSAVELLAVASNMVGKLIALQDQRKYTAEQIIKIVQKNIEIGNAQAVADVTSTTGPKQ